MFIFKESNQQLMLADLQGVVVKKGRDAWWIRLTDPAIHCMDTTRFGKTNLGEEGNNN